MQKIGGLNKEMRMLQKFWILTFLHKIDPDLNQILRIFYVMQFQALQIPI